MYIYIIFIIIIIFTLSPLLLHVVCYYDFRVIKRKRYDQQ